MWMRAAMDYLVWLQVNLPLPGFAFFGALLEEVVSPIPSSVVQVGVGSLASNQHYLWYGVLLLGLVGAAGNTIGALLQYGIYRLIGGWIIKTFGRWVSLTPEKIQKARDFLQKGARDDVAIFVLRALPVVPLVSPSAICGIIGIKASTFAIATFLGYAVRNSYMLMVGFVGLEAIMSGEKRAWGLLVLVILVSIGIVIWTRREKHVAAPAPITDEA